MKLSEAAESALDVMAAAAGALLARGASTDAGSVYAREKDLILGALYGDAVTIDRQGGILLADALMSWLIYTSNPLIVPPNSSS